MRSFWLFCLSASLWGQTLTLPHFQEGAASLAGTWRFHPGDDPRWADPNFDDSGWKLLRMPLTLKEQGYPNFQGYGWYRLHLRWGEQSRPLSLILKLSRVSNVGEVFANSTSVCRFGSFPPHPRIYFSRPILCAVASDRWTAEGRLLLAVRVWKDPRLVSLVVHSGLDEAAPEIGLPVVMQSRMDAAHYTLLKQRLPDAFTWCVELILALYLFALAFTKTRKPEYFWFGLYFCTDVVKNAVLWIRQSTSWLTASQALLVNDFSLVLLFWSLVCGLWSTFGVKVGPAVR